MRPGTLNIVLIVVDSLRACSLRAGGPYALRTPFFERLDAETVAFTRAYATECWTLPTHLSMFTGLLPSEHGAHFRTMAYTGVARTLAERLAAAGYYTEIVTRNTLFDGTIPGATRGFAHATRPLAELRGAGSALAVVLMLAKPRVRRLIRASGFFHAMQKSRGSFLLDLARVGVPADRLALNYALEQMDRLRRRGRPGFLCLNLYDVHAPYSPSPRSPLRPFRSVGGCLENLSLPWVLPKVSSHGYLRHNFRLSEWSRRMLLRRYGCAVELMDAKLEWFYREAQKAGLLENTLLVITSDHGEAFGEHGLYFHDASVYNTHLHVPLWIHYPDRSPETVTDVVSTRALFSLLGVVGAGGSPDGTLLDPAARQAMPVALAEHFHYPHVAGLQPQYRQDIAAAIVGTRKVIVHRGGFLYYNLARDPGEEDPEVCTLEDVAAECRKDGVPPTAVLAAMTHLGRGAHAFAASARPS